MSSIELILAYRRERYPLSVFVPFAILIAVAGIAASGSLPTISEVLIGFVLAFTLILVFRIADDFADLGSDRLRHPGRVLVQASSVTPIVVFAFLIAAVAVLILLSQPRAFTRLAIFAALSVLLLLWYFLRAKLRAGPLASAHAVLLKYPVISLLTCANWDHVTILTALPAFGVLYLALCIYEQLHDRTVRDSRGAQWIIAAELGLLVTLPLMMLSTGGFL